MSLRYDGRPNELPPPLPAWQYSLVGQLLFKRSSATRRMRYALAVDGASAHNLPALAYKPLEQPGEQIRLLSRHHSGGWTLTNFVAADAPDYAALSYAWGSPDLVRIIIVNQCVLKITESCWYALLQLDRMRDFKYFWIDAICINQTDLVEKGPQVRIMGDIFARAASTFVFLGQCNEDIWLISEFARQQEDCTSIDSRSPIRGVTSASWSVPSLNTENYEILVAVLRALQEKPWWRRLWVLQEAWKSDQVSFMCGATVFTWKELDGILSGLRDCYDKNHPYHRLHLPSWMVECHHSHMYSSRVLEEMIRSHMCSLMEHNKDYPLLNFDHLLLITTGKICSDLRDIIYSILSLVQQPENLPRMSVDYSISTWSVAKNALNHYSVNEDVSNTISIVKELTSQLRLEETIEFRHLQDQRHVLYTQNDSYVEETSEEFDYTSTRTCITSTSFSPLVEQLDGQLSVDMIDLQRNDPEAGFSKSDVVNIDARPLVLGSKVVGYTSGSAQPGDLLVNLELDLFQICVHPILRRSSDRVYRIVGMAAFANSWLILGRLYGLEPLKLYFDTEDLFFLACISRRHDRAFMFKKKSVFSLNFCFTRTAFSSFAVAAPM